MEGLKENFRLLLLCLCSLSAYGNPQLSRTIDSLLFILVYKLKILCIISFHCMCSVFWLF